MTKDYETRTEKIGKAWDQNKYALVIEMCRRLLSDYPKSAYGWYVLSYALIDLAKYDEAKISLNKCTKYIKQNSKYRPCYLKGHLYRDNGQNKLAERWYRKAIEHSPKLPELWVFLGAILARQGKYKEAKIAHRKCISLDKATSDEAHFNLALIFRAEGRYQDALKHLDKAIKIDPKYIIAKNVKKDILEAIKYKKSNKAIQPGRGKKRRAR